MAGRKFIIILTRAGKEEMGDALGDWLGRFRALNLGTTATLTLRRGMFCGKRNDQTHCRGRSSTHSSERPGRCLLVPNAEITFTGCCWLWGSNDVGAWCGESDQS